MQRALGNRWLAKSGPLSPETHPAQPLCQPEQELSPQ